MPKKHAQQKKMSEIACLNMASSDERRKAPVAVKTADLSWYKAQHQKAVDMVPSSKKRIWLNHQAAMDEALARMKQFGLKQEVAVPTRSNNTSANLFFPVRSSNIANTATPAEGGVGVPGVSGGGVLGGVAPAFSGWTVWAHPDEILAAAERIKEARALSPPNPDMKDVSLSCFGAPTVELQEICQSASLVRAEVTWFQRKEQFFVAMRKRLDNQQETHEKSAAVGLIDAGGLQAPAVVTLPPKIPKLRAEVATAAVGIVEQYESFIVVDGSIFSPIRQWGKQKRPPGVTADSLSNRCVQYVVVRGLNSSVAPEELKIGMAQMLKEGKAWRKEIEKNKTNEVACKSFWPEKAAELYNSLNK
jgi:hypothetical protein